MAFPPATAPTIHFVGVSTGGSSIMKVFPEWARALGFGDAQIHGIDLPLHAPPERYRETVEFIRADPLSRGALVTTHKLDLYAAASDLFDECDWFAQAMREVSSISKRDGRLIGQAKDPISAGRTLTGMLPAGHFEKGGPEVLCLGAGGAGVAITWFLLEGEHSLGRPAKVTVTDTSTERLRHLGELVISAALVTEAVRSAEDGGRLLGRLPPESLVINATGLGKDREGSPLPQGATFPENGIVWELNYRGTLEFLHAAEAQRDSRFLAVHDGWAYFIHGWSCVVDDVFGVDLSSPARFQELSAIAARVTGRP